ncbi:MAG: DNA recombination protein RmuC [Alphaproteobacteria bacterium]
MAVEQTTLILFAPLAVLGGLAIVLTIALLRSMRARAEAENEAALAHQQAETAQAQMADWEKTKAQTIEAAKAAALSSTRELSSKLLDDHKRESESANKAAEERVRKTTEDLQKHFGKVVESVASLNDQVGESRKMVDTVWRALSSPGGAGHFAEIGLENTLKSFGLQAGRDFIMQYTVADQAEGRRLRPDAVVFLPGDTYLVVDSKASKYLLEIAEAEGAASEEAAYANLAGTMNQHLRALAAKDYKSAVLESARQTGRGGAIRRLLNVMYLPNEGAVEKISRADPDFQGKAVKSEIIVTGPTGLASLIAFASIEIDLGRQAENQERIVDATQSLLDSMIVVLGHAEGIGKGIRTAADRFAKFTKSVNRRMLPRARTLAGLGVRPAGSKALPKSLPAYEVVEFDASDTIEAEAERIEDAGPDGDDAARELPAPRSADPPPTGD